MGQFAWMLSLIPDAVLVFLVHLCLVVGVVLSILGTFSSKFPFVGEYGRLAKLIGIPLFLLGIFFEGGLVTEMKWRAQVEELQAKVKVAEEQSKETNTVIQTEFRDKVKTVKEVQVVVQERIVKEAAKMDAECKVEPEVINILNQAAGGKK
jgi:hypothetical protein